MTHYLIDLDNVLLNTFCVEANGQTHFYWSEDFERDFGKNPRILGELFQWDFLCAMHQTTQLNDFITPWLQKHEIQMAASDFLTYWLARDSNLNDNMWQWIVAQKKKGHQFHIASNQPIIRMEYIWDKFQEWHVVFKEIFIPADLGVAKPDVGFFKLAQAKLNVPFQEMCLIDDSPENIQSARSLGMKTILFDTHFFGKERS